MIRTLLERLLGLLRLPCGAYGGALPIEQRTGPWSARWCLKSLGHSDSCRYDDAMQPLWRFRLWGKGYPWSIPSSQENS